MDVVSFHHVQLAMPTGGEPSARAFYSALLDIPEVSKPALLAGRGGCWFELDELRVHLGVDPDFRPAVKAHTAFLVRNLVGLAVRLEEAGYTIAWDKPLLGQDRFYAGDPFGNRLEFVAIEQSEERRATNG